MCFGKNQRMHILNDILTLFTVTAEAADLAIETVMGEVSTSPILLNATRAFWSFGVTLVDPFCCNDVDSCRRPLGIPGWPLEFDALDSGTVGREIWDFFVRLWTLPPKDCVGVYSGIWRTGKLWTPLLFVVVVGEGDGFLIESRIYFENVQD